MARTWYLQILRWASEREEFTFDELCAGTSLDEGQRAALLIQVNGRQLFDIEQSSGRRNIDPANDKLRLSIDDEFRLMEYDELQEARRSSRDAMWAAKMAMWIAIVTAIASIGVNILYGEQSTTNSVDNLGIEIETAPAKQ